MTYEDYEPRWHGASKGFLSFSQLPRPLIPLRATFVFHKLHPPFLSPPMCLWSNSFFIFIFFLVDTTSHTQTVLVTQLHTDSRSKNPNWRQQIMSTSSSHCDYKCVSEHWTTLAAEQNRGSTRTAGVGLCSPAWDSCVTCELSEKWRVIWLPFISTL